LDIKYKYIRFTGKVIAILPFLLINCFVFVLVTLNYAIVTASFSAIIKTFVSASLKRKT